MLEIPRERTWWRLLDVARWRARGSQHASRSVGTGSTFQEEEVLGGGEIKKVRFRKHGSASLLEIIKRGWDSDVCEAATWKVCD